MRSSRVTQEQITAILNEQEAGAKTAEVRRRHGTSDATLDRWKAKYGGLEVSEARRLKALEGENAGLKRTALPGGPGFAPRGKARERGSGMAMPPRAQPRRL